MGFCTAPPALVFEFVERGSLHSNLHDEVYTSITFLSQQYKLHSLSVIQDKVRMTWQMRCKSLKDACRGLAWLHGVNPPLIHQDIKSYVKDAMASSNVQGTLLWYVPYFAFSANILLDKHYNAKLGDFGFARQLACIADGRTLMTAPVFAKSLGYFPPELHDLNKNSPKSDVYSYGVVSHQ